MTRVRMLAVTMALICTTAPASAQNTEDQNAFDFSLPGARSRGIGGAFVAIADDATSVYSNPAGLTVLFRPELSIEGRRWNLTNRTPTRGHAFGAAREIGADTITGLVDDSFHSRTTGVSFASAVYPADRWAFGAFFHQLAQYEMNRVVEGPFFDCRGGYRIGDREANPPFCEPHARTDGVDREFPKRQSMDLDIRSVGAAFAYELPASVSLGVAVQYFRFSLESTNTVFAARGTEEMPELKYQPANFADPENVELLSRQWGKDHAVAVNAGVLWNASRQWALGASFRQGPRFRFSTETRRGAGSTGQAGEVVGSQTDNPFQVPDTFALGLVYRPTDLWRLSVEYDRVQFSQLVEDFRNTAFFRGNPENDVVSDGMRLPNANQLRVGAEYLLPLPRGLGIALRGGVWRDPNHQTYFDADPATGYPAPRWTILFPKRSGQTHVSSGVGFVTRRHFQLDAAVDLSELVDTFTLSSVWRF